MEIMGCEVVEMQMLKGGDIAIKQGDILFVWPGFQMTGEFKYIVVPTQEEREKELREKWAKELNERLFQSWESKRIEYLINRSLFFIP